jgi:hypothetical protein
VTVFIAKATVSGRKVTVLPPKVTVSAILAPEHCHSCQHPLNGILMPPSRR